MNDKSRVVLLSSFQTASLAQDDETRGMFDEAQNKLEQVVDLTSENLKQEFENLSVFLEESLSSLKGVFGDYELESFKIKCQINLEGKLVLLGSGVSANGGSGFELNFKLRD